MPPRRRATTQPSKDEPAESNDAQLDTARHSGDPEPAQSHTTSGLAGLRLPIPTLAGIDGKRLLWYGGLGALATLGILDWPVALVVGAGTIVARGLTPTEEPPPRRVD